MKANGIRAVSVNATCKHTSYGCAMCRTYRVLHVSNAIYTLFFDLKWRNP